MADLRKDTKMSEKGVEIKVPDMVPTHSRPLTLQVRLQGEEEKEEEEEEKEQKLSRYKLEDAISHIVLY